MAQTREGQGQIPAAAQKRHVAVTAAFRAHPRTVDNSELGCSETCSTPQTHTDTRYTY